MLWQKDSRSRTPKPLTENTESKKEKKDEKKEDGKDSKEEPKDNRLKEKDVNDNSENFDVKVQSGAESHRTKVESGGEISVDKSAKRESGEVKNIQNEPNATDSTEMNIDGKTSDATGAKSLSEAMKSSDSLEKGRIVLEGAYSLETATSDWDREDALLANLSKKTQPNLKSYDTLKKDATESKTQLSVRNKSPLDVKNQRPLDVRNKSPLDSRNRSPFDSIQDVEDSKKPRIKPQTG